MTGIAVVASAHDAKFAEEVRAGLQAAGLDASVSQSLPKAAGPHVVLIWSAALEADHAIDAQALIGLWSEDRLVTVRRDETPLPLGLRDLPSLPPSSTAEEVCAAVPGARYATARPPAEVEQVLVGSMADAAKPEADVKEKLAEAPKEKKSIGVVIGALVAIVIVGGGGWYYFNKSGLEKQAALTSALESATKAMQELRQAHVRELEALKALEQAREAVETAHKSGDLAKLKEAQEAASRAEAEAAKLAALVKQREAAAADARKKAQDGAASAKKAAPTKTKISAAAPVSEAPKAEAPKAEAAMAKAPEPGTVKLARPMSRSEREQPASEGPTQTPVASVSPSAKSAAEPQATSAPHHDALYQQAVAMEQEGKVAESVRIYRRAARAGNGKAAKRLGEIYEKGVPGVSRDYAESLAWYETARQLGETVETAGRGGSGPAVVPSPARPAPEVTAKSAPPPAAAVIPEPPKAAAPVPSPAPAPVPPKAAAEPTMQEPESKSGWFSLRGLLIALFVLGLITWRRYRRRERAQARQAQRPSAAAVDRKDATSAAEPRFSRSPQPPAQQSPPQGDSMLFVSYSHKDRPRVEPIVSVIEEMGRRVWIDRSDITGQTGWAGQIVRAIRECRAVVLMASPNSYNSDQVVRELYLAMNHRKTIVPIEIEPAEMPDELQYILAPFQHHRLSAGETRTVLGRALAAV